MPERPACDLRIIIRKAAPDVCLYLLVFVNFAGFDKKKEDLLLAYAKGTQNS
jgi:hypothetical protein